MTGCQNELIYIEDDPFISLIESSEISWIPLSPYEEAEVRTSKIFEYSAKFVETEHAIVFVDTRDSTHLSYINKQTGDIRTLCGDPLCKHTDREMCSAVCDVSTASSLVYSPEDGRLYYVRRNDLMASPPDRFSNIVSIDIDSMEFSLKYHYSLEPGNEITSMKYDNNKLYFTHIVEKNEEEKLLLSAITLSNNKMEDIYYFDYVNTRYVVQDDIVYYYNTGDNILYSYDIIHQTSETLVDTKSVNRYLISQDSIICQTPLSITSTNLITRQTQTIFTPSESGFDFDCTVDSSGNIYFYGYTPISIDTSRGQQRNSSGGKIYRLSNDISELYIDLGSTTFIKSICAIQDTLFLETYTYNESQNTKYTYYFISDNTIQKLP